MGREISGNREILESMVQEKFGTTRGELFKETIRDTFADLVTGGASVPMRISRGGLLRQMKEIGMHAGRNVSELVKELGPAIRRLPKELLKPISDTVREHALTDAPASYRPRYSASGKKTASKHNPKSVGFRDAGLSAGTLYHEVAGHAGMDLLPPSTWKNPELIGRMQRISDKMKAPLTGLTKKAFGGDERISSAVHYFSPKEIHAFSMQRKLAMLPKNKNLSMKEYVRLFEGTAEEVMAPGGPFQKRAVKYLDQLREAGVPLKQKRWKQ